MNNDNNDKNNRRPSEEEDIDDVAMLKILRDRAAAMPPQQENQRQEKQQQQKQEQQQQINVTVQSGKHNQFREKIESTRRHHRRNRQTPRPPHFKNNHHKKNISNRPESQHSPQQDPLIRNADADDSGQQEEDRYMMKMLREQCQANSRPSAPPHSHTATATPAAVVAAATAETVTTTSRRKPRSQDTQHQNSNSNGMHHSQLRNPGLADPSPNVDDSGQEEEEDRCMMKMLQEQCHAAAQSHATTTTTTPVVFAAATAEQDLSTVTMTHGQRPTSQGTQQQQQPGAYSSAPGQRRLVQTERPRFSLVGIAALHPTRSDWDLISAEMSVVSDDDHHTGRENGCGGESSNRDNSASQEEGLMMRQQPFGSSTSSNRDHHHTIRAEDDLFQSGRTNSTMDLVVANPVMDPSGFLNLPIAEEHVENNKNDENNNKNGFLRASVFCVIGGVGVIVVVGITLLVVFLRQQGQVATTNTNTTTATTTTTTTALPGNSTSSGTSTRESILQSLPEDTQMNIQREGSPQNLSFQWLINDPQFTQYPDWRIKQRLALATLYYATSGNKWTDNTHWLNYSHHECVWYTKSSFGSGDFFTVAPPFSFYYVTHYEAPNNVFPCSNGSTGRYQHLWLDNLNLEGIIPDELCLLMPDLKSISLGMNRIGGKISSHLGRLTNLEALGFYATGLTGTIPNEISSLTKLSVIFLISNQLTGPIPDIRRLSHLRFLTVTGNTDIDGLRMTGTLQSEIGLLSNLRWLFWADNKISGKKNVWLEEDEKGCSLSLSLSLPLSNLSI